MTLAQEGCLLRIFIGEDDKHDGRPLYEWIVQQARREGLAGATVLRGMMGFGGSSRAIHSFKIERLTEQLPVVVEIVDIRDKLNAFSNLIDAQIHGGLATIEPVEVRFYRKHS